MIGLDIGGCWCCEIGLLFALLFALSPVLMLLSLVAVEVGQQIVWLTFTRQRRRRSPDPVEPWMR